MGAKHTDGHDASLWAPLSGCILFSVVGLLFPEQVQLALRAVSGGALDIFGDLIVWACSALLLLFVLLAILPLQVVVAWVMASRSFRSWLGSVCSSLPGWGRGSWPGRWRSRSLISLTRRAWVRMWPDRPCSLPTTTGAFIRAIYGMGALVLAHFAFNKQARTLLSSPIEAAFSGRWVRPTGRVADNLKIIAVGLRRGRQHGDGHHAGPCAGLIAL